MCISDALCELKPSRFFFTRRKRYTRCLSDWSSDVCSSDLLSPQRLLVHKIPPCQAPADYRDGHSALGVRLREPSPFAQRDLHQIQIVCADCLYDGAPHFASLRPRAALNREGSRVYSSSVRIRNV